MAANRFLGFVTIIAGIIAIIASLDYPGLLGSAAFIGGIAWVILGIIFAIKGTNNLRKF